MGLRRNKWKSICNLLLATYAAVGAAISLAIAVLKPSYGTWISPNGGRLTPATSDMLFSLFAKSIEIASSGVYVHFLGQFLTRRSLQRGISITDMTLREWLSQPAEIIFHWGNIKYAGTTILGSTSFLAAAAVYFFTTASNSLVSPHIASGKWESTQLYGNVQQDFGNNIMLKQNCWAPLDSKLDTLNPGESCVNVLAAGISNQDLNNYMKTWSGLLGPRNITQNFNSRPPPTSSILGDTSVTGSWVQIWSSNVTFNFAKWGRVVNNITLSMPHPVVSYASADPKNDLPQADPGSAFGGISVKASVLSPSTNTLCVNMQQSEVEPLVYVEWPNARVNTSTPIADHKNAAQDWEKDIPADMASLQNNISQTGVESIFQWGPVYNNRFPPVFPQV
jgi:hypothetical protein